MLRTCILAPHMNAVATAFLLLVGYRLLWVVISLWTHLIREVGSVDQARQEERGLTSKTDGQLAGIAETKSCWLIFGRVCVSY